LDLQKQLAEIHRRITVKTILTRVEEINDLMRLLGIEYIDLAKLRQDVDVAGLEEEEKNMMKKAAEERGKVNDLPRDYYVDGASKRKKDGPLRSSLRRPKK
jgi:hypothetical protein